MKQSDPRNVLKSLFRKQLIGPGSDYIFDQAECETISDYPLNRYSSGIIFPKMIVSELYDSITDTDDETDSQDEDYIVAEGDRFSDIDIKEPPHPQIDTDETKNEEIAGSELFPNSIGLSFCLNNDAKAIDIEVSFGTYSQIDPTQMIDPLVGIKMDQNSFKLLEPLNAGNSNYLGSILKYDPDTNLVSLRRVLKGSRAYPQSEDFMDFSIIRRNVYEQMLTMVGDAKKRYEDILKLMGDVSYLYKNSWQRQAHKYIYNVHTDDLSKEGKYKTIVESIEDSKGCFRIHITQIEKNKDYQIIKILLENANDFTTPKKSLKRKPVLNSLSMFQSQIKVNSQNLREMPKPNISPLATMDDKIADCQYRGSKVFAFSHNCACKWDIEVKLPYIHTEFLPDVIPPVSKNYYKDEYRAALNIYHNSKYSSKSDKEVFQDLSNFVSHYASWIDNQVETSSSLGERYLGTAEYIVRDQKKILRRLEEGVEKLKNNDYMEIFRLTNSIMCINMLDFEHRKRVREVAISHDIHYHAFQLAFLLINIKSITDHDTEDRTNNVDLLWFPTGGGKTEAYFLLAIYSLLYRRISMGEVGLGTSIIMRYTLRLLTAQQFERASRMILSMNYVCHEFYPELIEKELFSIGLWVGLATSPNKLFGDYDSAQEQIDKLLYSEGDQYKLRSVLLPILECPWCNTSLVSEGRVGFNCTKQKFEMYCLNPECHFKDGLPIDLVDESMYNNPPTLLFATVDKFASLAHVDNARSFFGSDKTLPPDLIIQDELHLISGPLGSITALFENVVNRLCQNSNRSLKIVASTATIKNAETQVRALFGNRSLTYFPPAGINFDDNFFAKVDETNQNREYLGIYPTGRSFSQLQLKTTALTLFGRLKIWQAGNEKLDNYWTVVTYFNSLRELGRMFSRTRDQLQQAYKIYVKNNRVPVKYFGIRNPKELTRRVPGHEVKRVLKSLEKPSIVNNHPDEQSKEASDIVFATNMISVGLDIARLNLIIMNGQPKSVSEYIQVSSRIARNAPGLVISLFNPFRIRDKSHFENFSSFHLNYYRFVEPISVTPYTRMALSKVLPTMFTAYLRMYHQVKSPIDITLSMAEDFKNYMKIQMQGFDKMHDFLVKRVDALMIKLREQKEMRASITFDELLIRSIDKDVYDYDYDDWLLMYSMREVSPNAVLKMVTPKKYQKRGSVYDE